MSTCATCKHWQPEEWIRKSIDNPDIPNDDYLEGACEVLEDVLAIEENEVTGYGTDGQHGIAKIETPWDFGCNKWEAK